MSDGGVEVPVIINEFPESIVWHFMMIARMRIDRLHSKTRDVIYFGDGSVSKMIRMGKDDVIW